MVEHRGNYRANMYMLLKTLNGITLSPEGGFPYPEIFIKTERKLRASDRR